MTNQALRRLAFALASSYLLMFFSELLFYNEEPALNALQAVDDGPLAVLVYTLDLTLWYLPATYLLLWSIDYFRVHSLAALFLAGCLFGWVTEGVVVPFVYTGLPITLVWPSVGWHAPIDVVLGWYGIAWVLGQKRPKRTLVVATLAGLGWGIWATWVWVDPAPAIAPDRFALFAAVYGGLALAAWAVCFWLRPQSFVLGRVEQAVLAAALLFLYAAMVLAVGVLALVLLPAFGVVLWALRRNRVGEIRPNLFTTFNQPLPLWQTSLLLPFPLSAALAYTVLYRFNIELPLADIVAPLLMLIGTIILFACTWVVVRRQTAGSVSKLLTDS